MKRVDVVRPTKYQYIVFDDGKNTRVAAANIQQFLEDCDDLESVLEYCEKYGFEGKNITDKYVYADHPFEEVLYPILFDKNVLLYRNNRPPELGETPKYMLGPNYRAFAAEFHDLVYSDAEFPTEYVE